MRILVAFCIGLIFGIGLVVSGMSNPAKVLNFFDVFGSWDPSLAFVMAGAVAIAGVGFRLVLRRPAPILSDSFDLPGASAVDSRLMGGAAIFGVGWGLSGFCPGPAFTAVTFAEPGTLAFLPAMLAGMWAARALAAPGDKRQAPA